MFKKQGCPQMPWPTSYRWMFDFPHHEKGTGWECPREVTRKVSRQGGKEGCDKRGLGWWQCPENQGITWRMYTWGWETLQAPSICIPESWQPDPLPPDKAVVSLPWGSKQPEMEGWMTIWRNSQGHQPPSAFNAPSAQAPPGAHSIHWTSELKQLTSFYWVAEEKLSDKRKKKVNEHRDVEGNRGHQRIYMNKNRKTFYKRQSEKQTSFWKEI